MAADIATRDSAFVYPHFQLLLTRFRSFSLSCSRALFYSVSDGLARSMPQERSSSREWRHAREEWASRTTEFKGPEQDTISRVRGNRTVAMVATALKGQSSQR